GLTPSVMDQIVPFMGTLVWGTLPLLFYFVLRRYLQGMNVVRPISFALISANVINAFFNWVLIYGNLAAPALGIKGSAWPTNIARFYMFAVLAVIAWWHDRKLDLLRGRLGINFQLVSRIFRIGVPVAVQIGLEIAVFAGAAGLIATIDATQLAAHE